MGRYDKNVPKSCKIEINLGGRRWIASDMGRYDKNVPKSCKIEINLGGRRWIASDMGRYDKNVPKRQPDRVRSGVSIVDTVAAVHAWLEATFLYRKGSIGPPFTPGALTGFDGTVS
jgi:hypothetical protein